MERPRETGDERKREWRLESEEKKHRKPRNSKFEFGAHRQSRLFLLKTKIGTNYSITAFAYFFQFVCTTYANTIHMGFILFKLHIENKNTGVVEIR